MAATKGIPAAAVLAHGISRHAFAAPSIGTTPVPSDAEATVTVTLNLAEALGVGLSMKVLAHEGRMPAATAAKYEAVGAQIVAACRSEIAQRTQLAAEERAK